MQIPPQQWNMAQSPRPSNWALAVVFIVAVLLAVAGLAFWAFGGLVVLGPGGTDAWSCSNSMLRGEYGEAIPSCRSVVTRLPRSGEDHNNLAWCLVLDGQVPEGLVEARKAVALEPDRDTYDTLAMALALSGQGKEALQIETEHVLLGGDAEDNMGRVTLGMVYYAVGRRQEAHAQWEIARTSHERQPGKLATEFEAKYP